MPGLVGPSSARSLHGDQGLRGTVGGEPPNGSDGGSSAASPSAPPPSAGPSGSGTTGGS